MKKKAIYARQSIEKKDSISTESQISFCKNQLKANFENLTDNDIVIYKESRSGKNTANRTEFQRMMEDVKNGVIDTVSVYKLDRISRNLGDFYNVWKYFQSYDIQFISCNEKFDTSTPIGKAMLMITMVFAEMERETIVERVTDNYFQRAERGFYLGGTAPFGFKKIDIVYQGKKTACFEAIPELKAPIKEMFEEYGNTNISIGKLAKKLNDNGIKTAKGNNWSSGTLNRILRSPVYVRANVDVYQYYKNRRATLNNKPDDFNGINGCYIYAPTIERTEEETKNKIYTKNKNGRTYSDISNAYITIAPHEGIVDSDIWLKCQCKLDNNKQVKCDRRGTHTWLSGLMKCDNCGYGITVVNNCRGHFYINCYGKKIHVCNGRAKTWEVYEIENYAQNLLLDRLKKMKDTSVIESKEHNNPELEHYKKESVKLEQRIENLLDELEVAKEENANLRVNSIRKRIDELTKKYNEYNDIISKLTYESNTLKNTLESSMDINYVIENWNDLEFDRKKFIAKSFIKSVVVGDENIEVFFNRI